MKAMHNRVEATPRLDWLLLRRSVPRGEKIECRTSTSSVKISICDTAFKSWNKVAAPENKRKERVYFHGPTLMTFSCWLGSITLFFLSLHSTQTLNYFVQKVFEGWPQDKAKWLRPLGSAINDQDQNANCVAGLIRVAIAGGNWHVWHGWWKGWRGEL